MMPRQELVARYLWNMALCEALYPSLHAIELALRNTISSAAERMYAPAATTIDGRPLCFLSPLLNRVRLLRNYVFHHEPIWHWRDLPDQHALAVELIGWMSPSLRETVEAVDRFDAVYSAGLAPYRELLARLPALRP